MMAVLTGKGNSDNNHQAVVICNCTDPNHELHLSWWDEIGEDWPVGYILVHLVTYGHWWRRVGMAIRYIFHKASIYGDYDEIIITPSDARRLMDWLKEFSEKPEPVRKK